MAQFFGQRSAFLYGGVVDRFENVAVQLFGFVAVEGHTHEDKRVGQTLYAEADGAVFKDGAVTLLNDRNELSKLVGAIA